MKNKVLYIALCVVAGLGLGACQSDDDLFIREGEGTVFLSASVNTDVKVVSRAATADELAASAMIWISNSKGVVRQYNTISDIPAGGVILVADNYVAEAWTGDSVPASFDDRYFKGVQEFSLEKGDRKSIEIVCKIANTLVTVDYADNIDEAISDYTFTVGHSQGSLEFTGRDDRTGYFMMNSRDKDLKWTLNATDNASGNAVTLSGQIGACKPATRYNVHISGNTDSSEIGGGYLTVTIDESEVEEEDVIEILGAPVIKGVNFSLDESVRGSRGNVSRHSLWVSSSNGEISSLILGSECFDGKYGLEEGEIDFNLVGIAPELKSALEAAGINFDIIKEEEKNAVAYKINFEEEYLSALPDGEYDFTVTVEDPSQKKSTATMHVVVSDATVTTIQVTPADVHSYSVTIRGEVNKEDAVNPRLQYRQVGAQDWIDLEPTAQGAAKIMVATITGLIPEAEYEYRAVAEGFEGATYKFTTENANQLPNSGFEDWQKPDKPYLVYGSGDTMFWDSGNHGSVTMNMNVTLPDEDCHSGTYSAKLASQFVGVGVIGKFAAGNVFIGEYLGTQGTNGVLGWGRPWTSRPSKLHGWVKYSPVAITSSSLSYAPKGDPDTGIIYIALLDNSINKTFEGKSYPVVVNTGTKEFFSRSDSNVVGYGEVVFDGNTNGWIEFTVDIEYVKDVKPSFILCTASASRYGDYFTGGNGSTMWLDDLELIYE